MRLPGSAKSHPQAEPNPGTQSTKSATETRPTQDENEDDFAMLDSDGSNKASLTIDEFLSRSLALSSSPLTFEDVASLRADAMETENLYRELFARKRESWEIPEIDDKFHFLLDVYSYGETLDTRKDTNILGCPNNTRNKNALELFQAFPKFKQDDIPRVFTLDSKKRRKEGELTISPSLQEFESNWDCLTEGSLRHLNWDNVLAAGGAVSGCLTPLPTEISSISGLGKRKMACRKYFHDEFLPGSDIDLFLYGLDQEEAEEKLLEIYDAVVAANPHPVRAFRSANVITLVSQYPFRHIQIVLRLYNSPSEVLMGFDVDSCAVGYDGERVVMCPRTNIAFRTQCNLVDMSRRSPSYEMRLAKYANRGFEVMVPCLDKSRIDPFLFEKRFDQVKGLSRLLLLEKLRTPEERLRYQIENQLKSKGSTSWRMQERLHKLQRDPWNLSRQEDGKVGALGKNSAAEASNYSTTFLPWGPLWSASKCEKHMKKKDKILNQYEFKSNGQVVDSERSYRIHLCAVGNMEEVIRDPYPDDPPLPDDLPSETRETLVYGKVSWLVDNPGRQQIGSFHPITNEDWTDGAYFAVTTEQFTAAAATNDINTMKSVLDGIKKDNDKDSDDAILKLLSSKDFLGRSSLHLAVSSGSKDACQFILNHPLVDETILQLRLPDGRTPYHICAMKGNEEIMKMLLQKRHDLATQSAEADVGNLQDKLMKVMDIDGADWDLKFNPLQYAVALGKTNIVRDLLEHGASARKVAVEKDKNLSISTITLLAQYTMECGKEGLSCVPDILKMLLDAGASFAQIDSKGHTCWHYMAFDKEASNNGGLEIFLSVASSHIDKAMIGLDILNSQLNTPLYLATYEGNDAAVKLLLQYGATAVFDEDTWNNRMEMTVKMNMSSNGNNSYNNSYLLEQYRSNRVTEMFRCPVAFAALHADTSCLKEYLSYDSSLANVEVRLCHNFAYFQNPGSPPLKSMRPLNLLTIAKEVMERGSDHGSHHRQGRYEEMREILKQARSSLDSAVRESGKVGLTYEGFVWTAVTAFLSKQVGENDARMNRNVISIEETEAISGRIGDAKKIIEDAGGKVSDEKNEDMKESDVSRPAPFFSPPGPRKMLGTRAALISAPPTGSTETFSLQNPIGHYREMSKGTQMNLWTSYQSSVEHCALQFIQHPIASSLSSTTVTKVTNLMTAAFNGTVDEVRSAARSAKICSYYDAVTFSTPLFLAVARGNHDVVKEIVKAANEQYQTYLDEEKVKSDQLLKNESKEEEDISINDQIRRINNLDIAAGEIPTTNERTPEQMRAALEAAEISVLTQSNVASDSTSTSISSSIPPQFMLLYKSWISPSIANSPFGSMVLDAKKALRLKCPRYFSEDWLNESFMVTPMELAVLVNDIKMMEELLSLAEAFDETKCNEGSDIPMTELQFRFILMGYINSNFHRHTHLRFSLLELAVVMDNVEMVALIVKYGKEFCLPYEAIDHWKSITDTKEDATCLNKRQYYRYNQDMINSRPLLHLSLNAGAEKTSEALMKGELDEILIGWLMDTPYTQEVKDEDYHYYYCNGISTYCEKVRWVSQQIFKSDLSREQVAIKLVRATSCDKSGRTALFYAPASFTPAVIQHGAQALSTDLKVSIADAAKSFVEQTNSEGFTALMSASACGDVEKMKRLLGGGAMNSATTVDGKRGLIHMALAYPSQQHPFLDLNKPQPEGDTKQDKWEKIREIMQILLDSCQNDEETKMLLSSPLFEHTPLMVAINAAADDETLSFLTEKIAKVALDSLARLDNDRNSIIHLATKSFLNHGSGTFDIDCIKTLLSYAKENEVSMENARGLIPSEIALEAVCAIWNWKYFSGKMGGGMNYYSNFHQVMKGKLTLKENIPSEAIKRQLLDLLLKSQTSSRVTVSFDDVQKTQAHTLDDVERKAEDGDEDSEYSDSDYDSDEGDY